MNLFLEYPKMKTLFKLIPSETSSKKWDATSGEILPETAALHYLPLEALTFTEKIDGTNMGIHLLDYSVVDIQKRNGPCSYDDKSDWYYCKLTDEFCDTVDAEKLREKEALQNCILYGEACGAGIQKGGVYFQEKKFLLFDIFDLVTNHFFTWTAVKSIATDLGIECVPEITYTKPDLSAANVKDFVLNLKSAYNPNTDAEGMVVRYTTDTVTERRWMAKIRRKDFMP